MPAAMRSSGLWVGVLAVLGLGAITTTPALASDGAEAGSAAVGTASASGVRTSYDFPGYLVVDQLFDAGGPIAQSVVNSSGGGTAFASFPYPGETIVNAPALANVGTGQAFPFTYPLFVLADGNLTPKATAQDPTGSLDLSAEAAARVAHSTARLSGPSSGVVSTAGSLQQTSVAIADDGVMTSIADSVTRGIDVGVLKIGEVHVRTVSVLKPGQSKPTTTSSTDVTSVSVLGKPVGLTKDGLVLLGDSGGSPQTALLSSLNEALTNGGLRVALAGEDSVAGGSSSAGVEILQKGKMPFAGSPVGVARTLIGNASSFILGGSDSLAAVATAGTGSVLPGALPAVAAAPGPGVGTTGVDAAGSFPLPIPAATATGDAGVPTVALVPQGAAAAGGTALVALDVGSQLEMFYLVIALGAGLAVLSSLLWRAKGGRSSWTS